MMHRQQGLSLIGVAIFMALLAAAGMCGLYWMRYERNPITDIMNGQVGKTTRAGLTGVQAGKAEPLAAIAPPAPAAPTGPIRKCQINGKTVYSDVECPKSGEKLTLHDNQGFAPPPKPVPEADSSASATVQQKALDKAIEKATR